MLNRMVTVVLLTLLSVSLLAFHTQLAKLSDQTTFFDDFNDGVADGWTEHLGTWNVVNGEYFVTVGIVENGISTVNGLNLTDCAIETKLRFSDTEVGFRAGIVFRYIDDEHYYSFELSNEYDNMGIGKYTSQNPGYGVNIVWTPPGTNPIQSNTEYDLRVEIHGNKFTCFVNNQEMFSGADDEYGIGKVGLRARNAYVSFDNFRVQGTHDFPVLVTGYFRLDIDSKWRCYGNATITNDYEENITIRWIHINAINVTYIDDTHEEIGVSENRTINQILLPGNSLTTSWILTAYGFDKEPKIMCVEFKSSVAEFQNQIMSVAMIPEFPLFLILPLFIMVTLLSVLIYRRKFSVKEIYV